MTPLQHRRFEQLANDMGCRHHGRSELPEGPVYYAWGMTTSHENVFCHVGIYGFAIGREVIAKPVKFEGDWTRDMIVADMLAHAEEDYIDHRAEGMHLEGFWDA